jgi:NTE family protein
MPKRRRLGLVLGAGSARGWAHIGVIRALAEQGIAPDIVVGCSIGALVGASLAAGRLDQLEAFVRSLDWKGVVGLLDVGLRGGLIKGGRLLEFFREQFVERDFSELPMPFGAVATDLATGQEVWLREGSVSEAVRASIAIPGMFQPVRRDDAWLVDGSLVNPVPVSLARAMGANLVIAVDLASGMVGRFERDEAVQNGGRGLKELLLPRHRTDGAKEEAPAAPSPSLVEALLGAINIMQVRVARSRLAGDPADVLLTPRLAHLGLLEYHRGVMAIEEGRDAVVRMMPAIRAVLPGQPQ